MNPISPLFFDENMQAHFELNGFVTTPLLTPVQADKLRELFMETEALHETVTNLHYTTTDTQNQELIRQVDIGIKSLLVPELAKILQNFKPLASCFHVKKKNKDSALDAHQDLTFVNEDNFVSANVWVALHDINEQNGNIYFVSGSNRVHSLRLANNSPKYYEKFQHKLKAMAVQVPLKKGEAVIFNNATIHGSTENMSDHIRLAATLLVCSKPAEWLLFYKDAEAGSDKIETYALDFDGFIAMAKDGRPGESYFKGYFSYDFPVLTYREFINIIKNKPDSPIFRYLNNIYLKFRNIIFKD